NESLHLHRLILDKSECPWVSYLIFPACLLPVAKDLIDCIYERRHCLVSIASVTPHNRAESNDDKLGERTLTQGSQIAEKAVKKHQVSMSPIPAVPTDVGCHRECHMQCPSRRNTETACQRRELPTQEDTAGKIKKR
ncbi:hypothetical protein GJAV_G00111200, partial [Gymnothorax javanicus]